MKFQYHSEPGVKLLLIQCAYKKDLALYLIDPPSSPRGRRNGRVIFPFNSIHQPTYLPCQCMFQKPLFPYSHFLSLHVFFVLPFPQEVGGHAAKERFLREGFLGIFISIGWVPKACGRCFFLLVSSMLWATKLTRNYLSFFIALFSAYLGATVTNMLSVVSSLLAKVLFPKTDIFLTCEVKHQDLKSNSAKGRTDLSEEPWAAQGMAFPLKFIFFLSRSFHELPQAILFCLK